MYIFCFKNCTDVSLLNKLFWWSQIFCKFSALSLIFQKFFWINRTIFSHIMWENFGNKIPLDSSIFPDVSFHSKHKYYQVHQCNFFSSKLAFDPSISIKIPPGWSCLYKIWFWQHFTYRIVNFPAQTGQEFHSQPIYR